MSAKLLKPLSALALAMTLASPAHATLTNAASNGYALNAGLDLLSIPLLDLTLLGKAQGSTPGTYSDNAGLGLNVNASVGAGFLLEAKASATADLLYGKASFDGSTVKGEGGVEQLGISLSEEALGGLIVTDLLSLSVGTLWSTSTITGDYGSLNPVGESWIADLELSVAGLSLTSAINADISAWLLAGATANYHVLPSLLGTLGVDLVLNEQTLNKDCASLVTCANIETNALHLTVDPLGLSLVGVEVILGHSYAEVAAGPTPPTVPLPGTLALMTLGLGLMAYVSRRRALV